jgi:hypothetical protein
MPFLALSATAAFDSDTTQLLAGAFEAAWAALKASDDTLADGPNAGRARELLARRIIELGRRGERDQVRLVEDALDHLARLRTPVAAPA